MVDGIIWITWEKQIRNRSLSSLLEVECFEIVINSNRILRYLKSFIQTLKIIKSKSPNIIIAPNPSIVLSYFLLALRKTFHFSLISDAHMAGIQSCNNIPFFQRLLDNFNEKTDLVIVTNDAHADYIRSIKGKAFVCQDPLPFLPEVPEINNINFEKSILFICSFDNDEPYEDVFEAFNLLKEQGYSLFVSGKYSKVNLDINRYPDINFLGYIPTDEYYGYLKQCSVVIDLTTMENCLVCGAYEALSARKLLVLSDTFALKSYFSPAAAFTNHSPQSIANAIVYAYEHKDQLLSNIQDWVSTNKKYMTTKLESLKNLIMQMKLS
jgi:hypothetical protein